MWGAVSSLLTDPATLQQDLQAMIEREGKAHGDPEAEARAWAEKLAELERKRDKFQEMFAAEAVTLNELKAKLLMKADGDEFRMNSKVNLAASLNEGSSYDVGGRRVMSRAGMLRGPTRLSTASLRLRLLAGAFDLEG